MGAAHIRRQRLFQPGDFLAQNEVAFGNDLGDAAVDVRLERLVLGAQIMELHAYTSLSPSPCGA